MHHKRFQQSISKRKRTDDNRGNISEVQEQTSGHSSKSTWSACKKFTSNSSGVKYVIKFVTIQAKLINNTIHPNENDLLERKEWFFKLKESILKEGIRNPVVLTAKIDEHREISITPRYGGSRIMIAQTYNLRVPAIVADFNNIFPLGDCIKQEDIRNYFQDKPKKVIIKDYGINISGCPDIHME